MFLNGVVYSRIEPKNNKVLWLKPVGNGVCLYVFDSGWTPLRIVNDMDTFTVEDDVVIDTDAIDDAWKDMYYKNLYIGVGMGIQDILTASNYFSVVKKNTNFSYTGLDGESIFIAMSSDDTPDLLMSSIHVPIQQGEDIIVNGRTYHTWHSSNAYSEDIRITLT